MLRTTINLGNSRRTASNRSRRRRSRSTSSNREDRNNRRKQHVADAIRKKLMDKGKYDLWVRFGSKYGLKWGSRNARPNNFRSGPIMFTNINSNPDDFDMVSTAIHDDPRVKHYPVFQELLENSG